MNFSLLHSFIFCVVLSILQVSHAFVSTSGSGSVVSPTHIGRPFITTSNRQSNQMRSTNTRVAALPGNMDFLQSSSTLLSVVTQTAKPADYEYGAVAAPSWVLPVAAVLVILTAAIPILLRPGEQALDQQRVDEESTNNQFNRRKKKDL